MANRSYPTQIDVAQLSLYAFWVFFAGLICYLRIEDRREGYPAGASAEWRACRHAASAQRPNAEVFTLRDGGTTVAGREERDLTAAADADRQVAGAPLVPPGNPMADGVGPAAYAIRADVPDLTPRPQAGSSRSASPPTSSSRTRIPTRSAGQC